MQKLKTPVFLSRLNSKGNKRKLLLAGFVVFGIFAVWFINGQFINNKGKVFAYAAGHKIYESELREFVGDTKGINDHDAAQVLADKYFFEALAKEQGITVSSEEINQALKDRYNKIPKDYAVKEKYTYQQDVNQLYFSKLQAHNRGAYKGKLLIANFSRHVQFYPTLPEDKAGDPKLGDPAAIAKDKKYAQDLMTRLYNDVKSGKISFDQAIKIEHKDPKVGKKAYPTLSHSRPFDSSYKADSLLDVESIREKVRNIQPGELTEPFVVSVPNSFDGKSMAESFFLTVQMDQSSVGAGMDFDQYLDKAKNRLGYEIYV